MGCRAMPSTTAITVMMRAMMISRIMSSFRGAIQTLFRFEASTRNSMIEIATCRKARLPSNEGARLAI